MIDLDILYDRLKEEYPDAKAELDFTTDYELLIATILSAQCTDIRVNKVTKVLFSRANTPEDMVKLNIAELESIIKPCGMYHQKAKNILSASNDLIEKFNSEIPRTHQDLMSLAGVGRKTANVVLSNAFNINAIAVDTHVKRLSNRIGLSKHSDPLKVEEDLMRLFDESKWSLLHHLLIFHGRRCCYARNPNCLNCIIEDICPKKGVKNVNN